MFCNTRSESRVPGGDDPGYYYYGSSASEVKRSLYIGDE
jgi:hypothetical protein